MKYIKCDSDYSNVVDSDDAYCVNIALRKTYMLKTTKHGYNEFYCYPMVQFYWKDKVLK